MKKEKKVVLGLPMHGALGFDLDNEIGSVVVSKELSDQPPHVRIEVYKEWVNLISRLMANAIGERDRYLRDLEKQLAG